MVTNPHLLSPQAPGPGCPPGVDSPGVGGRLRWGCGDGWQGVECRQRSQGPGIGLAGCLTPPPPQASGLSPPRSCTSWEVGSMSAQGASIRLFIQHCFGLKLPVDQR